MDKGRKPRGNCAEIFMGDFRILFFMLATVYCALVLSYCLFALNKDTNSFINNPDNAPIANIEIN